MTGAMFDDEEEAPKLKRAARLRRVVRAALMNGAMWKNQRGAQQKVADLFGVTRQRVSQIVREELAKIKEEEARQCQK